MPGDKEGWVGCTECIRGTGEHESWCEPHSVSASSIDPTPSLPPGLEVVTEPKPTCPVEVILEEGSPEEVACSMPQEKDPGTPQSLDSTDLDIPIEAVTCESQGPQGICGAADGAELGEPTQRGWQGKAVGALRVPMVGSEGSGQVPGTRWTSFQDEKMQ